MVSTYREDKQWWWVDFVAVLSDGTKKRVRKAAPQNTRKSAEAYEHSLRGELQNAPTVAPEAEMLFEGFVADFLRHSKNNNKPSTYVEKEHILRNHLTPFFKGRPLSTVGSLDFETYKAQKLDKLVKKTINNHLVIASKFMSLAVEYKKLRFAPKIRLFPQKGRFKPVSEDQHLDFDEARRFEEAATPADRAMVTVALRTGLRIGELRALQWDSVDLKARKILVHRAFWKQVLGTPKPGRSREVPLSLEATAALAAAKHLRGPWVFCDDRGKPLVYSQCQTLLKRVERRAGLAVGEIGWHKLRHTFASHLAMKGVPLKVIQELLGHASIEMTMIYAHLSPTTLSNAVDKLDVDPAAGS